MKNKSIFLNLLIIFIFVFSVFVNAETVDTNIKVYDYGKLFSESESKDLSDTAVKIINKQQIDIVIVTIDNSEGKSSRDYADDFYDYNNFGIGEDRSGILMLINMQEREVWISTSGKGIPIYTDKVTDKILDSVYNKLSEGSYYASGKLFLEEADRYIYVYEKEKADYEEKMRMKAQKEPSGPLRENFSMISILAVSIFMGFGLGGLITFISSRNNNLSDKTQARNYISQEGFKITQKEDSFLNTDTVRIPIPKSKPASNTTFDSTRSSSTHTSSSGRTHGGGGRKF